MLNIQRYAKKEIALNQLETALDLFFAKRELFSVITLAGAAEEIFGQLLRQSEAKGRVSLRTVLDMLRTRKAKGSGGAASASSESELYVHMDVRQEALFLLGRAIDDYQALAGELGANMLRFNEEARGGDKGE